VTGIPALLGGLGLVAVAFGLLSAALALFQPVTDLSWILGNLAVGVLLLSAALFVGFDSVRQRLRSGEARRVGKYGSSAVLSTILLVVILGMLGFVAERHPVRFDWSEGGVNTLTEQSRDLLARLDADVTLTAFFQRTEVPEVAALLDRYAYASDRLEVVFVDPNSVPLRVEELALDPDALAKGLVRAETGDSGIVITDLSESGLTNGLLRLVRSSEKKVYFVEGHNERRIVDDAGGPAEGRDAMGRAADALRNETYRVEPLAMATRGAIPEDADAVVIAGPTRAYFDHEIAALRDYAARGGALLVLLDPRARTNLYPLLEEWGVVLGDDVVVDQVQAVFNQATMPLAGRYAPDHPITRDLDRATLFPMVRSVEPTVEGLETIVYTGTNSWAERDLDGWQASGRAEYDEDDLPGPVPIAVAGTVDVDEGEGEPARLVVFGDSDFASNEFLEAQYNRDLFLNTVNWLVGDVEQISIRPRLSRASRFELGAAQFRAIVYLSLFVLPEGIAVAGVVAWWLRRGRGGA
jgi:ABC-type uncharacterized transport system involved in gliding motility auxiliary subunit